MVEIYDKNERIFVVAGFALSLLHWTLCAAFFLVLTIYLLRQGIPGAIKVLLIVTVRCLLSTVVAASVTGIVQIEKWALIFLLSFYIVVNAGMHKSIRFSMFGRTLLLFAFFLILSSFFVSDYPVISIFKVISYAIPFYAISLGVRITNEQCRWIHYLKQLLLPIVCICVLTIPFQERFNIINGTFQGVLNHPNMAGIFLAIFVGCFLFDKEEQEKDGKKPPAWFYIVLLLCFYMLYASASRTGMFSALLCVAIYWYGLPTREKTRGTGLLIILFVVLVAVYLIINPSSGLISAARSFAFKRSENGLLDSRQLQIEDSKFKLSIHPLTGSGFGVPYNYGVQNWKFAMQMPYESGNLYYTLLGDTGYIGITLFTLNMLSIVWNSDRKKLVLFALPLIISLGEMAFFSTNNIAILYYVFYGICMDKKEKQVMPVSACEHQITVKT